MELPAKDGEHETKAGIYETWAVVNRAFEQIVKPLYRGFAPVYAAKKTDV